MNEISCLREGINPHDVWTQKVTHPVYAAFFDQQAMDAGKRPLSCYTPWEYSLLYPLNLLPERLGAPLYLGVIVLSLVFLGRLAFVIGKAQKGVVSDGHLVASIALLMPFTVFSDCTVLNFGVLITAALALMAVCLQFGHNILAGFCLSFAMIKPQMAFLFVVPLLLKRKWTTLVVGATTCLILSVPPALLCGTSPVDLIVQSIGGNTGAFVGCDLLPYPILKLLRAWGLSPMLPILVAAAAGGSLCLWLTFRIRKSEDWLSLLLPAAVLAPACTYATPSNRVLLFFPLVALGIECVRAWPAQRTCLLLLFFMVRPAEGVNRVLVMASGILSAWQIPPAVFQPLAMVFSLTCFASCCWVTWRFCAAAPCSLRRVET